MRELTDIRMRCCWGKWSMFMGFSSILMNMIWWWGRKKWRIGKKI